MSKQTTTYVILYLAIFIADFAVFHLFSVGEESFLSGGMTVISCWFTAYLFFIIATPWFYKKTATMSYGRGFLMMCIAMMPGGLCIWIVFGGGNYSSGFYKYEFVTAGIWFVVVNALMMLFIRLWKSMSVDHKRRQSEAGNSRQIN